MKSRTIRFARLSKWVAVPAAVMLSGVVVAQSSYSAFSATTSNAENNWSTGTVALSNDGKNTAAFTATDLRPGSTGTRVIAVTSSGSVPSTVKLYGTNATTTNSLSSHVTVTVTQGTGGSFATSSGFTPAASNPLVYSGTLANFAATAKSYSTGLGTWAPAGGASETRTYQITYAVDPAAPNSTQGGSATIGFTWEAQNS